MVMLDIFNSDAFSAVSMTKAIEKTEFVPSLLGSLTGAGGRPLFEFTPVRTETVAVERRDNALALVPTSPRGAPPTQKGKNKRKLRNFNTVRLAVEDTIWAHELQNIRAMGEESELQQVQQEVAYRQMNLRQDIDLTLENLRLGCIQGKVYDSNGTDLIYDYYSEFSISEATEIDFELDDSTTNVRGKCQAVIRNTARALGGLALPTMEVVGLANDTFFDALIDHDEVRDTYKSWAAAAELREDLSFREFRYGGIRFINYRGMDDDTNVKIATDKCRFFPLGVPGFFQMAHSPAERMEFVNTPGRDVYSWATPDQKRNEFVDVEVRSYPLPICTVPAALQRAKRA